MKCIKHSAEAVAVCSAGAEEGTTSAKTARRTGIARRIRSSLQAARNFQSQEKSAGLKRGLM